MDFENFFYVVLAVIYFLSRVFRKQKNQAPPEEAYEEDQPTTTKKPVSFEDLLKEFVEEKAPEPELPEPEEVLVEEAPRRYQSEYTDDEAKSIYEQSVREAEQLVKQEPAPQKKSLAFKEFEPYQEQEDSNEFAAELKEMLQSPEGGKKAIILGEILNRRY